MLSAAVFLVLAGGQTAAQKAAPQPLLRPGNAVVTGFSGTTTPYSKDDVPENSSLAEETFLDGNGASLRVLELEGRGSAGSAPVSPQLFEVPASEMGQVFGLALDDATLPDGRTPAPNIYVTATSAYGLHIVGPDADGDGFPERLKTGAPDAEWMWGQFGFEKGGGPGSIWKIDGVTGEVSLFANVEFDGAPNSGPALGNIAFDPANRQLFVSDRDTGMIHRFDLQGAQQGVFDHGLDGRPARGLHPVGFDPDERTSITSSEFNAANPESWGHDSPERRIWGLAVHDGRLYYAVAQGPQIWSVAIRKDGGFGRARWEIDLPEDAEPYEVSDIAFDGEGRMVLAQRAPVTGDFDYAKPIGLGGALVLRYRLEKPNRRTTPSRWVAEPQKYAIGQTGDYRNADGGIAFGYGYVRPGSLDYRACHATLWSTGDRLKEAARPTLAPHPAAAGGDKHYLDGLQGNAVSLARPENAPRSNARFVDYDGAYQTRETSGHVGDVEIPVICDPDGPYAPPQPPPLAQRILDLEIEKDQMGPCTILDVCRFTITVRNRGSETYRGALVVRDVVSQPDMALVGSGAVPWKCGQSGVDIICHRPDLVLRPGRESRLHVDFRLRARNPIPGWRDCSTISWLGDRKSEAAIRAIQIELGRLGFYAGPIDGDMTPATRQGIKDLQAAAGLAASGAVRTELLALLFGSGAHGAGDSNPANDSSCVDVEYVTASPGSEDGSEPGQELAALKVAVGGPAECSFGQDCQLALTVRNRVAVPFDQEIDGLLELRRKGEPVRETIAERPSFCSGPQNKTNLDCRFRLELAAEKARTYPMRLKIRNRLLDPGKAANRGPDGQVRAEVCFSAKELGWFGWLPGSQIDRDCRSVIVSAPEAAPEVPAGVDEVAEDDGGTVPESAGKLQIKTTARASTCRRGAICLFDISVKNGGQHTTGNGIRFIAIFPEGLRNQVIASSDGTVNCKRQSDRRFLCTGDRGQTVEPGQEFKLEASMMPAAESRATKLKNCVRLAPDGDEADDADGGMSCAQVDLVASEPGAPAAKPPAPPELTIAKRAINATCKPGVTCWFEIIVTNAGKDDYRGEVELRDFLKLENSNPGWPVEFASLGQWQCDRPSETADYRRCTVKEIGAGETRTIAVKARIPKIAELPISIYNRQVLTNCASIHFGPRDPNGEAASKQACGGAKIDLTNQVSFLKLEQDAPASCPAGGRCEFRVRIQAEGERGFAQKVSLIDQAKKIGGAPIELPIVKGGPGCSMRPDRIPFNCERQLSLRSSSDSRKSSSGERRARKAGIELSYQVETPGTLQAGDRFENCFQLLFSLDGRTHRPVSCAIISVTGDRANGTRVTQADRPASKRPLQAPIAQAPPVKEPPALKPPAREPSADEPATREPPAREPPVREPPAAQEPVAEAPAPEDAALQDPRTDRAPLAGRFGPQLAVSAVADSPFCSAGRGCAFTVSIANRGVAPYFGPVVLTERMRPGNVRLLATDPGTWTCQGSNGRFICVHPTVRLDVGASMILRLRFRTFRFARGRQRNCAQLRWRARTWVARAAAAKQALSELGFDPGPTDAQITGRTREAIRRFRRQQKLRDSGAIDTALMKALLQNWGEGDQNAGDDTACADVAVGRNRR